MSEKSERETVTRDARGCGCRGCGNGCEGRKEGRGGGVPWTWIRIGVSAAALASSLLAAGRLPLDPAWVAVVLCGIPIVREALEGLVERLDVKADLLVAVALVASLAIGETFAAGEVALIMALGEELEEWTVARARRGIDRLARLAPRTARRLGADGAEETVPAEEVRAGDRLRVRPGEAVPADGTVESGATSVDQSALTGEPVPVDRGPGDAVLGGSVNRFGAFDMVATRPGAESAVARMLRLVASADAGKARIVRLADRWATWIVAAAFAAAAACWLCTHEVLRAVTILVVFCPCALVLATPTAVMAAIGNAARRGMLVREGDALERLATVRRVAFDKTGTLTRGAPAVVAARATAPGLPDAELLRLAAAAEGRSEHPLARAIVAHARASLPSPALPAPAAFESAPGRGVRARIEGREVAVGRGGAAPAGAEDPAAEWLARGATIVRVALDGAPAGFLALSDTLRQDAAHAVARVRAEGAEPVLLTGDHAAAAGEVARAVGIAEVRAGCLPEDKLAYVRDSEAAGRPVCMIGDGVNDAPALKAARVGIAVGGPENALAAEAADVAIVRGGLAGVPHLLGLARKTRRTILFNLGLSMAINFAAVGLAAAGLLGTVAGALVHNGGSFLVIANSARLLLHGRRAA